MSQKVGVEAEPREDRERGREAEHPGRHQRTRADPVRGLPGDGSDEDDQDRHRQEGRARLRRGVAEDVLHVDRHEEEDAEHGERHEQRDDVRPGEGRVAEEREVEHRRALVHLEQDEGGHGNGGDDEEPDDHRVGPAVRVGLDQREREREERDARRQETGDVEPLVGRGVARLPDHEPADDQAEDADGDVHEEDPAPVDVLGDEPADERADREGHRGDAGPDADRHPALVRRERRRDDRERRGQHQRGADALRRARADQHLAGGGEPAGERGEREDGEAEQEDAFAAEEVGQLPAREHQHREGEGVRVHRPLELARGRSRGRAGSTGARRSRRCCRA